MITLFFLFVMMGFLFVMIAGSVSIIIDEVQKSRSKKLVAKRVKRGDFK